MKMQFREYPYTYSYDSYIMEKSAVYFVRPCYSA